MESDTNYVNDSKLCRLWIGHLDESITEYQLLKVVQHFGEIEKFDIAVYRNGPNAGKSRSFAFVTYKRKEDAIEAKRNLHHKVLRTRPIVVHFAYTVSEQEENTEKQNDTTLQLPALSGIKPDTVKNNVSCDEKIKAIERKLKSMENSSDLDKMLLDSIISKPEIHNIHAKNMQTKPRNYFNTKLYHFSEKSDFSRKSKK